MASNMLFLNEPVLVIQPSLAALVGLNQALILQQVHYWAQIENEETDGHIYVFKTAEEIQKCFSFWSEKTIRRTITALTNEGLLIKINKNSYNRTNGYRVNYVKLDAASVQMEADKIETSKRSHSPDGGDKNVQLSAGQSDRMFNKNKITTTGAREDDDDKPHPSGHKQDYWKLWRPNSEQALWLDECDYSYTDIDLKEFRLYLAGLKHLPKSILSSFKNWIDVRDKKNKRSKRSNEVKKDNSSRPVQDTTNPAPETKAVRIKAIEFLLENLPPDAPTRPDLISQIESIKAEPDDTLD